MENFKKKSTVAYVPPEIIFTQLIFVWAPLNQYNRNPPNDFGHGGFTRFEGLTYFLHYAFASSTTCTERIIQYSQALFHNLTSAVPAGTNAGYVRLGIDLISLTVV